ncbi:serine/threonine-protein kinase [Okeania sp. KiyG1]|uniref:serine/threonine protein kinase n=1 Tax=Okeania sp. KiyG1 TaxID=2720165 RepID=UPI001920A7CF|nr:serine/threonine-protein kinase [Okeania sp. KiyG1]GGA55791.1 hypothetical protein CYANOKiyG1_76480 [Okeania sp. KiyG1]
MTLHQPNDIITQRYRIVTPLGQGGMGITYEAEDLTNYQRVALKVVSLQQAKDWKILELFEREAKVIANLHHPQIPKYLNYFYIDTNTDRRFYLMRELVSGDSLATKVEKGWHPTEAQVQQIAIQILDILSYLHQLKPAIIHRDIKPENIILQPDGKVFLVDFGAVQDIYRQTISLSETFVGTIGYMPPEQLRGKAYCASDLYSLGATLLYLLTHRSPDELPQKRMKIDFSSCVEISQEFMNWLEIILEPMWEDRFQSATAALNVLTNKSEMIYDVDFRVKGSRVTLKKTPSSLIVNIPPRGFRVQDFFSCLFNLFHLGWSGSYILSIMFYSPTIERMLDFLPMVSISFSLVVSIVVFGFFFSKMAYLLWCSASKSQIKISHNEFLIHWKFLIFSKEVRGKTVDINKIAINNMEIEIQGASMINCGLFEVRKAYQFGFLLEEVEQEYLVAEIQDFLEQLKIQESLKKPDKKLLD